MKKAGKSGSIKAVTASKATKAITSEELGIDLSEKVTPPSERLLSPNEIGKLLNVTGEAVKQWIYNRRLPAIKLANGYWKVKVADLEKFIRDRSDVGHFKVLLDGENPILQEAITQAGHQVVIASSSADAIIKAADRPPSIFILSHSNPELWKLAKRIREHKTLHRLPILVLASGPIADNTTDEALKIGIQGFLTEPVQADVLKRELDRVFNRN
jgi:CheY-like chemotaxis protein